MEMKEFTLRAVLLGLVLTALTRQYGVGSRGNKPQAVLP